jgi:hypothetical protein
MITPTLITKLQYAAYLIFMALNFSFVFLVWFCKYTSKPLIYHTNVCPHFED